MPSLPYGDSYGRPQHTVVQAQYRMPTSMGMYRSGTQRNTGGPVGGLKDGDSYISLADQGINNDNLLATMQQTMRSSLTSDQGSIFGSQRLYSTQQPSLQGSMRASMPLIPSADLWSGSSVDFGALRASMQDTRNLRASMDQSQMLSRSFSGRPVSHSPAITPRGSRPGSPGPQLPSAEDLGLTQAMKTHLEAHIQTHSIAGYGSQSLQAALHSRNITRGRTSSAYSYDREGEHLRNASLVLVGIRGELETKEVQREQIEGALRDINHQLAIMAIKYEENKQEVRDREVEIKTARRELLTDVETAIKESGTKFKDGRARMVKSLADYDTACSKMEQGLTLMKDIADELIKAPKYHIGTNLAPHYHGPINATVSPGGNHFTSPMGTVRPIGTSKVTLG